MIIDRLHHYSALAFLSALVLIQGMMFVGTQAAYDARGDLQVAFVNPELNTQILNEAEIVLRAMLAIKDKDEYSQVFFTLTDSDTGQEVNFEANKNDDGSWSALASWDTSKYDPGQYELSASVYIYNEQDIQSYTSASRTVYLAAADDTQDIGGTDSGSEDESGDSVDTSTSTDPGTDEPVSLQLTVLSPSNGDVLTENATTTVEFNQELEPGTEAGLLFSIPGQVIKIKLDKQGSSEYSKVINTLLYADGEYEWIYYIENDQEITNLEAVNITIDNSAIVHIPAQKKINFGYEGATLTEKVNTFTFNTNFVSNHFTFEVVNKDNAAVGSSVIEIPPTDGKSWVKSFEIPNTFIDGTYILSVRATDEETDELIVNDFEFQVDLPEPEIDLDFDTLELTLENPGSNLQGLAILRVASNQQGVSGYFVFVNTVDPANSFSVRSAPTDMRSIAAVDTELIEDGNYLLHFEIRDSGGVLAQTESRLVSVFNGLDQEESDEAEESSDEEENNEEQEDEEVVDTDEPEAFRGDLSCDDLGLDQGSECTRILSTLNNNLEEVCISQEIFEPAACEDYLNRVFTDKECQENNIIETQACKDFLVEKYASSLECQLSDTASCAQVVRDQYINRVVQRTKKRDDISDSLQDLHNKSVIVSEIRTVLGDSISSSDIALADDSLFVRVIPARKVLSLENEDALAVRNNAVLALDTDGDGLIDDLETYYGSAIDNPDTDGDGFRDGEEVKNGYNPNGEGPLDADESRPTLLNASLGLVEVQQPTPFSPKISSNFLVDRVVYDSELDRTVLNGKASPDKWVNIYVYSQVPMLVMTQSDANGNWRYTLDQDISSGYHEVYAVENNSEGNIVSQSARSVFFVNTAQAQTEEEAFFNLDGPDPFPSSIPDDQFFIIGDLRVPRIFVYYGAGVLALALVIVLVIVMVRKRRQRSGMYEATEDVHTPVEQPITFAPPDKQQVQASQEKQQQEAIDEQPKEDK